METHITRRGSFRSFLPPAGKACVKLCLPRHFLEKHAAFLLIKSIMGQRWARSGSGRAGGFLLSRQPWDSHTCFSGPWAPGRAEDAGGHEEWGDLSLPPCEWVEDPGAGRGVQSVQKPFRVGRLSTGSYGQYHPFFFFRKKEKLNIFIPFLIVFINFQGRYIQRQSHSEPGFCGSSSGLVTLSLCLGTPRCLFKSWERSSHPSSHSSPPTLHTSAEDTSQPVQGGLEK